MSRGDRFRRLAPPRVQAPPPLDPAAPASTGVVDEELARRPGAVEGRGPAAVPPVDGLFAHFGLAVDPPPQAPAQAWTERLPSAADPCPNCGWLVLEGDAGCDNCGEAPR